MARLLPPFATLLLALLTGACASSGAIPRPFPGAAIPPGAETVPADAAPPAPRTEAAAIGADPIISAALDLRGTPYRNGGSDPSGFDCSGFVQYVYARTGVALPREVREQYQAGETIELGEVAPGDLLFFETVSRGASHVGLALGSNQFIHAPSSTGVVRVERYTAAYWSKRFVGARRVRPASP
jgi:cell wall-associated NlpC family hydrolase